MNKLILMDTNQIGHKISLDDILDSSVEYATTPGVMQEVKRWLDVEYIPAQKKLDSIKNIYSYISRLAHSRLYRKTKDVVLIFEKKNNLEHNDYICSLVATAKRGPVIISLKNATRGVMDKFRYLSDTYEPLFRSLSLEIYMENGASKKKDLKVGPIGTRNYERRVKINNCDDMVLFLDPEKSIDALKQKKRSIERKHREIFDAQKIFSYLDGPGEEHIIVYPTDDMILKLSRLTTKSFGWQVYNEVNHGRSHFDRETFMSIVLSRYIEEFKKLGLEPEHDLLELQARFVNEYVINNAGNTSDGHSLKKNNTVVDANIVSVAWHIRQIRADVDKVEIATNDSDILETISMCNKYYRPGHLMYAKS